MLEAPNAGVLKAPNAGMLEAPNAGVLEAPNAGVLEAPNAGVLEEPNAGMLEELNAGVVELKVGLLIPSMAWVFVTAKTGVLIAVLPEISNYKVLLIIVGRKHHKNFKL